MLASFVVLVAFCLVLSKFSLAVDSSIEHVIVLVMENRAFDHLVGYLREENPNIVGCVPGVAGCNNPDDPTNPTKWISVSNDAVYRTMTDPGHSISSTTRQIYPLGVSNTSSASMMGFVKDYSSRAAGDSTIAESIMQCFQPSHVPIITTLAKEYALIDGWFASVPGPTEPNRCYAVSATSHGMGTNDVETMVRGLPQKTMFKQVLDMGLDYRLYMKQVPANLMFKEMRRKEARRRYRMFPSLLEDLKSGNMPDLSFIEPGYFDTPFESASDQHPDHDVSAGEQLIKEIYEAVRSSPVWNTSALVITWDEHGGFFDHVTPPSTNVPSPDGIVAVDDPFDFTRLGVRVPTVIVSPLIPKGTLIHANPDGENQFDHSSIPATVVHKLLSPKKNFVKPQYLNNRDAWARTFESVFSNTEPRTDCPVTLPDVPSHRALFPHTLPPLDGHLPLTELQQTMVMLVAAVSRDPKAEQIVKDGVDALRHWSELDGIQFIEPRMAKFMNDDSEDQPEH